MNLEVNYFNYFYYMTLINNIMIKYIHYKNIKKTHEHSEGEKKEFFFTPIENDNL